MSQFYKNVSEGQDWAPEPAQRYNDVNALLSQFGPTGAGRGGRGMANRTVYTAVNRSAATIGEGMAVEPSGGDLEDGQLVPIQLSAEGTSALWGVLLARLAPGEIGPVLLTGVATVTLSAALPAGTAYVAPGDGGNFVAASSGRAQVIATKDTSAIINIGGGGGGESESDVVLCQVSGGTAQTGYAVTMFADGPDQPSTGTGLLYITEIAFGSTLPAGSRILGHRVMIQTTGGTA